MDPVEPKDMPQQYKKHQWLVYTADFDLATVGWPMAVAEAQASGVGVCMPRIRPDLAQYVGQGGYLYDSIEEIVDLVRGPVPNEMREAGFAQAWLSDVQQQKHLLTGLWDCVLDPAGRRVRG
jgi:glycosyltransferase involved in cell wall biosynthesis